MEEEEEEEGGGGEGAGGGEAAKFCLRKWSGRDTNQMGLSEESSLSLPLHPTFLLRDGGAVTCCERTREGTYSGLHEKKKKDSKVASLYSCAVVHVNSA